jgi:hypothetical protein
VCRITTSLTTASNALLENSYAYAGLQSCRIEKIIDQFLQPVGLLIDNLQKIPLSFGIQLVSERSKVVVYPLMNPSGVRIS